jgi:hypothetical protein
MIDLIVMFGDWTSRNWNEILIAVWFFCCGWIVGVQLYAPEEDKFF